MAHLTTEHANFLFEIHSAAPRLQNRATRKASAEHVKNTSKSNPALFYVNHDDLNKKGLSSARPKSRTRLQTRGSPNHNPGPSLDAGDSRSAPETESLASANYDLLTMGRIQELRERMGSDKVKMNEKALWKCLGAEFLGTALLMFLGVGCVLKFQDVEKSLSFTGIAICWGFTVATLAQALGGVSCDINPAVTLACVAAGKTPIVKALMYILMQCLGALAGTSLLKAVLPDTMQGDWGMTMLAEGITPIQGCIIEIISTFMLVFTVFSVSDENRHDVKGSVPLAIGICVAAIVMCSGPLTGASLNPARSLGPSILANHFDNHWVYWVGPIGGAVAAALIYTNIFRQLRPDEIEALEAERQLRQREQEAKENGSAPGV